jgi:hypothetical protein
VEDVGDVGDPLLEEPERGRVREHEAGRLRPHLAAQVVDVDVPARVGLDAHQRVARHGDAGGIGAVRRVGDDDLGAVLAAILEVRAHEREPGQLALRARRGLERHGGEAHHLGQHPLEPPHELERSLGALGILVRVQVAEAAERGRPLVHARVVLHRARAERVEAGVDPERPGRELGEVADEVGLGDLGKARRRGPAQLRRDVGGLDGRFGNAPTAAARSGALVDELHGWSTSARRAMSAGVRFSVTATRSTFSIPG